MGLELIKTPMGAADAGIFNLPPSFDTKKYAAEWAEEGQVAFKQQRQVIPGGEVTADGWEIWKGDEGRSKPTVVSASGKKFVLMCRPKAVQEAVNAYCGNLSKKAYNREISGQTAAGEPIQDSGILTEERLRGAEGGASLTDASEMRLNPIPESPAATST